MSIVVAFPKARRHERASAVAAIPKTAGAAAGLRAARKASAKISEYSEGMRPRDFQFETADMPRPVMREAAATPPIASRTSSTVLSTECDYSRFVNMSTVHESAIAGTVETAIIHAVDTVKTIARRLTQSRDALELNAADLCRQISIAPNRWSQYERGDRRITLQIAIKLCERYGLTLDWIYRGDPSGLPQRLATKIKTAA